MKKYNLFVLMILGLFFFSLNGVNGLCLFNDEPNVAINDILVYDSNGVFKNFLSVLNNNIVEGDILGITLNPTTDDENNINQETFAIASENQIVDVSFRNYDNINFALSGGQKYDYTTKNLVYNETFYYASEYHMPIYYNNGNPQQDFNLAVKFNKLGFYELIYSAKDSCSESNFKSLTIAVQPSPNLNSYTCTGTTTVSGTNKDVYITDTCNTINLDSTSDDISLYYTGTTYSDLTEKFIYLNILGTTKKDIYVFTNEITYFTQVPELSSYSLITMHSNFNNYTIWQNSSYGVKLINFNGQVKGISNSFIHTYSGVNKLSADFTQGAYSYFSVQFAQDSNTAYGNYEFNLISTKGIAFEFDAFDFYNNYIKISQSPYNQLLDVSIELDNDIEIYNNEFININSITYFGDTIEEISSIYANIFKSTGEMESIINFNKYWGIGGSENIFIGKNVNGKYLGNSYLDENNEDIFTCPSSLNDVNYNGINYKVCSVPVLIGSDFGQNVYDYIIVTNEQQGGIIPIEENKKPVAIIQITPTETIINNNINWDISSSYDLDGSIVNKKVWIDNILYENINSGTITSNTPKIINFKVEVTDNEGLKDTIYRQAVFVNTGNVCDSAPIPYAEIEITNLNNNQYRFKAVNEYNGGESTNNLQYFWLINANQIEGKEIISSVDYNQTIYLTIFNGCNQEIIYEFVTSTNIINEFTEPIINLNCNRNSNTPPSIINCEVDYDLRGYDLNNISWNYNGEPQTIFNGQSIFQKIVNDIGQHTISVTITSNALNQKTEYYHFSLSNIIINETSVFGCTDIKANNYNSNANYDDGSCIYAQSGGITTGNTIDSSIIDNLFTSDINANGDAIVGLFKLTSKPLSWLTLLGFVFLGIMIIFLLFGIVGFLIGHKK